MSQTTLTVTQVKKKINTFGNALILYVIVLTIFRHGLNIFERYFPQALFDRAPSMIFYVGMNILILLLSFLPFHFVSKKLDVDLKKYYKKNIAVGNLFVYTCVAIGIYFIFTSIMSLLSIFFNSNSYNLSFINKYHNIYLIITNIAFFTYEVIVRPICDEYVFRGVIQRNLGVFGRYFGVIASALLYALSQGNLIEAVPYFFIGWFLSIVSIKYHSIKPTIKIHVFMSLYLYLMRIIPNNFIWVISISIMLIYIVVALFIFSKHRTFVSDFSSVFNIKLWKLLFTSSSIIVVCVVFLINFIISIIRI